MSTTVIQDRIDAIIGVPLCAGAGAPPPDGEVPHDLCVMEMYAWITGQEWTDSPDNCSQLIGAFMRRYNDSIDQAGRDELAKWTIANVACLARTADDGRERERGYIVADWAVRIAVPVWLELAGATTAAQRVRELPEIVDDKAAWQGSALVREVRKELPDWWTWRTPLREKMRAAVKEALKDKPADDAAIAAATVAAADAAIAAGAGRGAAGPADTATAATAALAAATVAALADGAIAAAAGPADPVRAAAAGTALAAAADAALADGAIAAATAAIAAAAADAASAISDEVDAVVYKAVYAHINEVLAERWAPATVPLKQSARELLDRLVEVGKA
jgi:hypothetical protein